MRNKAERVPVNRTGNCATREELEAEILRMRKAKIPQRVIGETLGISQANAGRIGVRLEAGEKSVRSSGGAPEVFRTVGAQAIAALNKCWSIPDLSHLQEDEGEV